MLDMGKYPIVKVRLDAIDWDDKTYQCRAGLNEEVVKRLLESFKQFGQQTAIALIDPQNGKKLAIMRGAHRCETNKRLGADTIDAQVIPISDLGPDPIKMGRHLSVLDNVEQNSLKELEIFSISGEYYKEGMSLYEIADTLKVNRVMVRCYILIQAGGPEIQDAAKKGILPLKKTADFLNKDSEDKDDVAVGSPGDPHPAGDSSKLQIDPEKRDKLIEALKNPNPAEAIKKLFAASDGSFGKKTIAEGIKFSKSGQGLVKFNGCSKKINNLDDFLAFAKESYLKWQEEQAKANTPKPKPNLKAKRLADAVSKAEKDAARALKKAAGLKAKAAALGNIQPPIDPAKMMDKLNQAEQAGFKIPAGAKTGIEMGQKIAELIKLQQSVKAEGISEEDKSRLNSEIAKKNSEIDALKKGLQTGAPNSSGAESSATTSFADKPQPGQQVQPAQEPPQ